MAEPFLGGRTGYAHSTFVGSRHYFPVVQTDSREDRVLWGEERLERRDRVTMVFETDKTAFYDFSPCNIIPLCERGISMYRAPGVRLMT